MIAVLGAGAFGTALAVVLARAGRPVTLWARDPAPLLEWGESPRLPGVAFPGALTVAPAIEATDDADTVLLAVPMQALAGFLDTHRGRLSGRRLVACCKGIDLASGLGPAELLAAVPGARPALISGPGFASDLAAGLPTAMTLACADDDGPALQALLSTATLRLYLSPDLTGVEIGGALKNVVAIACGIAIGAGLGESARAALMTRGYAEMVRYARLRGAQEHTLAGLSGLGDLVLTCASEKSRNFRHGRAIGAGRPTDPGATVEGVATAQALARAAAAQGLDLPVIAMLARLLAGEVEVAEATEALLARPLKEE